MTIFSAGTPFIACKIPIVFGKQPTMKNKLQCYVLNWMPHNLYGALSYAASFIIMYILIWVSMYFSIKAKIKKMNKQLQEIEQEDKKEE